MSFLFESERFGYRETTPDDAQAMYLLNNDPEVLKYTGDAPFASVDEARAFLENYTDFKRNNMMSVKKRRTTVQQKLSTLIKEQKVRCVSHLAINQNDPVI